MTKDECLGLYRKIYEVFITQQCDADTGLRLYDAVINSPNGDVIEIGSAFGGSTVFLIGAAQEVGKRVVSIDPYPTGDYQYARYSQHWKRFFRRNFLE